VARPSDATTCAESHRMESNHQPPLYESAGCSVQAGAISPWTARVARGGAVGFFPGAPGGGDRAGDAPDPIPPRTARVHPMDECAAPSPIPFDEFARNLLTLYQAPLRARSTRERMVHLLALLRAFGLESTADLTTPRLAAWIAHRSNEVATSTLIGELGYLQTACGFAVEEGWLASNPFRSRRLRVRRRPPLSKRHQTLAEMSRLLGYLRERSSSWGGLRLFALAATVAYTGMRRNEALFLRLNDVDLAERLIWIERTAERDLKTDRAGQPVPICDELAEVLGRWLPEAGPTWLFPTRDRRSPWTGGNPGTKPLCRLKRAAAACGVEGVTWLSLRHSWATHAETAWGLSDPQIQRILRHTSPMTSRRHYRHADAENLRTMVATVRYA
jgi:integrase